jgi:tRNA G37 N-methylase TrmD
MTEVIGPRISANDEDLRVAEKLTDDEIAVGEVLGSGGASFARALTRCVLRKEQESPLPVLSIFEEASRFCVLPQLRDGLG